MKIFNVILIQVLVLQFSLALLCSTVSDITRRVRVDSIITASERDIVRVNSILNQSSSVILIAEGIDIEQFQEMLEERRGKKYRHIDIHALMDRLTISEVKDFLDTFRRLDLVPFLIEGVELLLQSDDLKEELLGMLSDKEHEIVCLTDFSGYRQIEKETEIAGKVDFIISDQGLSLEGKKIAVIGASGFLGGKIHEILSLQDCDLIGTSFSNAESGFVHLDVTSKRNIAEFLSIYSPDIIIYAAAVASPGESQEDKERTHVINAEALKWIAESFSGKFVYISTDYVFDGKNPPYLTDSARNPLNYYGETKVEAEDIVRDVFTDAIIVRPSILYGYNSNSGEVIVGGNSLNGLLVGEEIEVDNRQIRYPVLVDDVAWSILRLTSHNASGIFHLGGRDAVTKYQLIGSLVEALGLGSIEQVEAIISAGNLIRPYNPKLILSDTTSSLVEGIAQVVNQARLP